METNDVGRRKRPVAMMVGLVGVLATFVPGCVAFLVDGLTADGNLVGAELSGTVLVVAIAFLVFLAVLIVGLVVWERRVSRSEQLR